MVCWWVQNFPLWIISLLQGHLDSRANPLLIAFFSLLVWYIVNPLWFTTVVFVLNLSLTTLLAKACWVLWRRVKAVSQKKPKIPFTLLLLTKIFWAFITNNWSLMSSLNLVIIAWPTFYAGFLVGIVHEFWHVMIKNQFRIYVKLDMWHAYE